MAPPPSQTLHVVFKHSAGGSLRQALSMVERRERVVVFPDDLSFGPIDDADEKSRAAWIAEHLGFRAYLELDEDAELAASDVVGDVRGFWDTALGWPGRRVVWTSRRVACERAGFLEWVRRAGEAPYEVIDLTDVFVAGGEGDERNMRVPTYLATMRPEQMVSARLFDLAVPASDRLTRDAERVWARLRSENAPFRRLVDGDLISAPIDTYDPLLLSKVGGAWERAVRIVGETLADQFDSGVFELSDLVLFARLQSLIKSGALEARGDPRAIRALWVRRAD